MSLPALSRIHIQYKTELILMYVSHKLHQNNNIMMYKVILTFLSLSIRGRKWVLSSWGLALLMIGWEKTETGTQVRFHEQNNIMSLILNNLSFWCSNSYLNMRVDKDNSNFYTVISWFNQVEITIKGTMALLEIIQIFKNIQSFCVTKYSTK